MKREIFGVHSAANPAKKWVRWCLARMTVLFVKAA
jgi:hypothetical protein